MSNNHSEGGQTLPQDQAPPNSTHPALASMDSTNPINLLVAMLTYPGGGFNRVTETMAPTGTHQKHADPEIERLSREVEKLTALCEKLADKPESGRSTKLPDPELFTGTELEFPGWMFNIRMILAHNPD